MKKGISIILVMFLFFSSFSLKSAASSVKIEAVGASSPSIEKAIAWAINIANDDSHGYTQRLNRRTGPDYDCSSFVSSAFKIGRAHV